MNCANTGTFILFADDTNIFVSGQSKMEAIEKANTILAAVHSYMKSNKLHINIKKSCYMHFTPRGQNSESNENIPSTLCINGVELDEVEQTKFLGVIIDKNLSWAPHIDALSKKLRCNTGQINRIKDFIPAKYHKTLYHTLFESHLAYGVTVWGGVSETKLSSLKTAQKHCIRVLFGDKAAYLDKFCTAARSRSCEAQTLGSEFYIKEHTKPLFNSQEILVIQNLHTYHTLLDTFKIIKTRIPISLYSLFTISQRKDTLLITPPHNQSYLYCASSKWNSFRNTEQGKQIIDFSIGLSFTKNKIRELLLHRQKIGDQNEWADENFQ